MAASTPESSTTSSLKSALDFFGKDDPEGIEKFKTVAFRALHEQRVDEELRAAKAETARLQAENVAFASELRALQASFDANVGDRERVLAFKSKRIEELNRKLRSAEATAASLRQTLTGSETTPESAAEGVQPPLFHALATCREAEFRRLYDEQRVQCEQLTQQLRADAALASDQQAFYAEKAALEAELVHLRDQLATTSTQHEAAVHFLERKLVFEHDRLRRANDADVAACRDAMETRMRAQLDTTTQRTVAENARVQLELRFQNRQLEQLLHELDRVTADKTRAQQETRVVEAMSAQLSKRVRFYEQLFAKMQERDAQRQQSDREGPVSPVRPGRGSRSGRERSLPRLSSNFELDALPPAHEPTLGSLDSESDERDGGEQLNAAADALETHLHRRELARKHVDAMLRYHTTRHARQQAELLSPSPVRAKGVVMGQAPLVRKKIVLSKATYAPSSYQRGRRLVDVPPTLDAFIRQQAAMSPPQRPVLDARRPPDTASPPAPAAGPTVLPELTANPTTRESPDRSDMWRARRSGSPHESPATARF